MTKKPMTPAEVDAQVKQWQGKLQQAQAALAVARRKMGELALAGGGADAGPGLATLQNDVEIAQAALQAAQAQKPAANAHAAQARLEQSEARLKEVKTRLDEIEPELVRLQTELAPLRAEMESLIRTQMNLESGMVARRAAAAAAKKKVLQ